MTNAYVLVASRPLQGISASIVYIGGFALLIDNVPSEGIGKRMGFVMSFGSLGFLISPFLGGIIYARLGYHAIFGSMMVFVVLDVILRLAIVTEQNDD